MIFIPTATPWISSTTSHLTTAVVSWQWIFPIPLHFSKDSNQWLMDAGDEDPAPLPQLRMTLKGHLSSRTSPWAEFFLRRHLLCSSALSTSFPSRSVIPQVLPNMLLVCYSPSRTVSQEIQLLTLRRLGFNTWWARAWQAGTWHLLLVPA